MGQHTVGIHTSSGKMWLVPLAYQLATLLLAQAQNACIGHSTFKRPDSQTESYSCEVVCPSATDGVLSKFLMFTLVKSSFFSENSDIQVFCGSQTVDLHILLCPIYFNGYNESLLALNSEHSKQQCKGTADWNADPPVVKFSFNITEEAITTCSSQMRVTQESGTGVFSDFSQVEYINIFGMVCSEDPGSVTITYHQEVMYRFSCRYPLQYLVNNTQMSVSGVSLAVKDNNGSFISTLSMQLYSDNGYSNMLKIPQTGLKLKTRIFVEVKASNLTNRFNVLLDRCYATTSPFPVNTSYHDLFVGCDQDGQTVMGVNGKQQEARFSFEAFRFVQRTDAFLSTYYIHCATRLCLNSYCSNLIQNCTTSSRRRRSASDSQGTTVSDMATITSSPITIRLDNGLQLTSEGSQHTNMNNTMLAVSVIAGVIGTVCLFLVAFIAYQKYNSDITLKKMALYNQG